MKIDWIKKISSRKFWALLAALATAILTGCVSDSEITRVVGIIGAVGSVVCYMLAEAKVDAAAASAKTEVKQTVMSKDLLEEAKFKAETKAKAEV